jgi:chromosome segregation ATPase
LDSHNGLPQNSPIKPSGETKSPLLPQTLSAGNTPQGPSDAVIRKTDVENLQLEIKHLKDSFAKVKRQLSDKETKCKELESHIQYQERELESAQERARLYENQDQCQGGLRQNFLQDIERKAERIEMLERENQSLKTENQKLRARENKFCEKSKEARERRRYSKLKKNLCRAEEDVTNLTGRWTDIRAQLNKAEETLVSASGDKSNRAKNKEIIKETNALIEKLTRAKDAEKLELDNAVQKVEVLLHKLDTLRVDNDIKDDPDLDLDALSSTDSQHEARPLTPELSEDRSSRLSESPHSPPDTTLLTNELDKISITRHSEGPWAKSVEPHPKQISLDKNPFNHRNHRR